MSQALRIYGKLTSTTKLDFRGIKLEVIAIVDGKQVASDAVDKKGNYSLNFRYDRIPANTELRVVPVTKEKMPAKTKMLSQTISAARFALKGQRLVAATDLNIPGKYMEMLVKITKTYQLNGVVYAHYPTYFETLAGTKLEFYEVDRPFIWIFGTEPSTTESLLGSAYSRPDGSYDFEFSFSYNTISHWIFQDTVPDIRVKIYQFDDGAWQQVYTGEVDWDIAEDFHRDYVIPFEDIIPVVPGGVKPSEGFRYISLGLIPIDEAPVDPHFSKGYVTCYSGDPTRVDDVRHQPLCDRLRIFGLFAEAPPVATYEVQLAPADEDGPVGPWEHITDALNNRKWDSAQARWVHQVLGPDPVTHRYRNIDTEPEADWHEHALKFTWNSRNKPDGYYAIRIIGYDAADNTVVTQQMPVIRVDNSVPDTELATSAAIGICGCTTLNADRTIRFAITAHDPEGHVRKYVLRGTRGNWPPGTEESEKAAGAAITDQRPSTDPTWIGPLNDPVDFTVAPLPVALAGCTRLAYNFELHSYGLSTNGYTRTPSSQHVKKELNLVVSE